MDAASDALPASGPQISDVQRLAPEVKGLILSHLEGDITSLRSCALVCTSWATLARPYLFRKVVCRPGVPARTWDDFLLFLTTSSDVALHIRWLTVDGYIPETRRVAAFVKPTPPEPAPAPNSTHAATLLPSEPPRSERPISLKLLSIYSCSVHSLMPLHHLFASIARIETFVLKYFNMSDFYTLPAGTLNVRIGTIHIDGTLGPMGQHFWEELRRSLTPGAATGGLCVSTRFVGGRGEAELSLWDLLSAFGPDVHSVTANVLGASCHDFCQIVGGDISPSLDALTYLRRPAGLATTAALLAILATGSSEFPEFPRIDLSSSTSIREIVLYLTTTSVKTGPYATRLYARLLENNWSLLSNAPTSLTHIELRFQRYGRHIPAMIDHLRAVNDPAVNPGPVRWSTVDEGTLARFPDLEAFTCVLCDGGFVEQYGPFKRAEAVASGSGVGKQEEYDDYVELLQSVLPRLDERGLLRFRMAAS
ncbi:hypothetical protein C8T65DRAFT_649850 [Cerioporus squamosus]|nr:hypothetical protein C8T65DRAFT_649850 [Cerioporus squamosus]